MNTPAKPIEPGCLAMIINAHPDWRDEFVGKVVRIIDRAPPQYPDEWDFEWPCTPPMCCHERNLMRMDDPDLQKQIESEQEKQILAGMPWTEVSNG